MQSGMRKNKNPGFNYLGLIKQQINIYFAVCIFWTVPTFAAQLFFYFKTGSYNLFRLKACADIEDAVEVILTVVSPGLRSVNRWNVFNNTDFIKQEVNCFLQIFKGVSLIASQR